MSEVSIGIEASQDRRRVSIVQVGEQQRTGKTVLVASLTHYLESDASVVEVVTAAAPFTVALDSRGAGRFLIDRLEDADLGGDRCGHLRIERGEEVGSPLHQASV